MKTRASLDQAAAGGSSARRNLGSPGGALPATEFWTGMRTARCHAYERGWAAFSFLSPLAIAVLYPRSACARPDRHGGHDELQLGIGCRQFSVLALCTATTPGV